MVQLCNSRKKIRYDDLILFLQHFFHLIISYYNQLTNALFIQTSCSTYLIILLYFPGDPLYVGFDLTIASFDSISEVSMVSYF